MQQEVPSSLSPFPPPGSKVVIVRSSYYPELVSSMEDAARLTLREAGMLPENIVTVRSPGSFEIPLLCKVIAEGGGIAGMLALGIIVQGETHHAGEVARACTDGLLQVQLMHRLPIAHAVLYVTTLQQAKDRCLGRGNKGVETARSLLHMMSIIGSYTRS